MFIKKVPVLGWNDWIDEIAQVAFQEASQTAENRLRGLFPGWLFGRQDTRKRLAPLGHKERLTRGIHFLQYSQAFSFELAYSH